MVPGQWGRIRLLYPGQGGAANGAVASLPRTILVSLWFTSRTSGPKAARGLPRTSGLYRRYAHAHGRSPATIPASAGNMVAGWPSGHRAWPHHPPHPATQTERVPRLGFGSGCPPGRPLRCKMAGEVATRDPRGWFPGAAGGGTPRPHPGLVPLLLGHKRSGGPEVVGGVDRRAEINAVGQEALDLADLDGHREQLRLGVDALVDPDRGKVDPIVKCSGPRALKAGAGLVGTSNHDKS